MSKEEFAKIAMALQSYFPRFNLLPTNESLELWFRQLQDLDYKRTQDAINAWAATEKFPPSIADIREMAGFISGEEEPTWDQGWQEVMTAIQKFGMYREAEAKKTMHELTRACVDRLGFKNLCISENTEADRANFRMIYITLAEREKQIRLMPEPLRILIAENTNKTLKIAEK